MGVLDLLNRLIAERTESAWLEFKHNNGDPEMIGRCVSACANGAMLAGKERAFIVFGIENKTKKKVGTNVRLYEMTKGNENFQNWRTRMIEPSLLLEFLDLEENDLRCGRCPRPNSSRQITRCGSSCSVRSRSTSSPRRTRFWACFCHCVVRWLRHDYMSNTTLRERFRLSPEDYQLASTVISDAKKAGRIVPAEEGQGNKFARYVPYWAR